MKTGRKEEMTKRPNCDGILTVLSEYLDQELDNTFCKHIERHLEKCEPCSSLINSLLEMIKSCANFKPEDIPKIKKDRLSNDLFTEIENFKRFIQTTK